MENKYLDAHFNHFHVDVNPPKPVELNNLLAENVVVVDASSAVASNAALVQKFDAAYSVCHAAVPVTHRDFPDANLLMPTNLALSYFQSHGITISGGASNVSLIEAPKHGALRTEGYAPWVYEYAPEAGYLGPDQITFVVEWMGKKFKVIETIWVANAAPDYGCPTDIKLPPATTGPDKRGALDGGVLSSSKGPGSNFPATFRPRNFPLLPHPACFIDRLNVRLYDCALIRSVVIT